ncbi:unnamed protein product [Hyaloperonospora brassicae]|uniref:RxLR effector protein n=1 Tax=Hyaloperonospora brassicae TaxID=162125 RepID=A0AAV0T2R9_HYABA|nr:unnamed protein product [Hyaloperonospora brassicae]
MKTMLGLVESDTNKLLTIAKAHTLSQQQSASNADRAIEFLTALTDKNLGLFKKHLVKTVKKRKQPEELDADTLVAKFLVTSFGDETLAKAFVKLGDADGLLAASKVRSMVFRKWAAEGKKLKDIIPLLKVTDDVEIFEPQVTNFLLKFGKETEGPDFLISDVNEAMLRHWGGNYARYISGILRWEAKQGGAAKFTAGSRYHWALSDLTQYPTSPDSLVNNLKIIQGQHSYLRDGEYLHLTDDQLKKVGEDYAHVLKLVSGDPV